MLLFIQGHVLLVEVPEMNIIMKMFLLIYLLLIALVTVLSVICILTSVFTPERATKNSLSKTATNGFKR